MNDKIYLSEHFTLDEMCRSSVASKRGISNIAPKGEVRRNLTKLCKKVLEPLRYILNRPIYINSGYRSYTLNKIVGGVPNSQHLHGLAADVRVLNVKEAREVVSALRSVSSVDQCILERKGSAVWVHVSYADSPRRMFLEKVVK